MEYCLLRDQTLCPRMSRPHTICVKGAQRKHSENCVGCFKCAVLRLMIDVGIFCVHIYIFLLYMCNKWCFIMAKSIISFLVGGRKETLPQFLIKCMEHRTVWNLLSHIIFNSRRCEGTKHNLCVWDCWYIHRTWVWKKMENEHENWLRDEDER